MDKSSVLNIWNGFYQVQEDDKIFRISLRVPGMKANNKFRIQVEDNKRVLRISGYRSNKRVDTTPRQHSEEGADVAVFEDSFIFKRRIFLSSKVSRRTLEARILEGGVIYLTVSKAISRNDKQARLVHSRMSE